MTEFVHSTRCAKTRGVGRCDCSAMRKIEKAMADLEQDYGYADTWPASRQIEWDKLAAQLHPKTTKE